MRLKIGVDLTMHQKVYTDRQSSKCHPFYDSLKSIAPPYFFSKIKNMFKKWTNENGYEGNARSIEIDNFGRQEKEYEKGKKQNNHRGFEDYLRASILIWKNGCR